MMYITPENLKLLLVTIVALYTIMSTVFVAYRAYSGYTVSINIAANVTLVVIVSLWLSST